MSVCPEQRSLASQVSATKRTSYIADKSTSIVCAPPLAASFTSWRTGPCLHEALIEQVAAQLYHLSDKDIEVVPSTAVVEYPNAKPVLVTDSHR